MLSVDWTASDGWSAPRIQPHENLQLSPAAMTLHYALQCFEGIKAYRGDDDAIRLFRPDLNAKRMTSSLQRLAMPTFDETAFVELLKRFVDVEQEWVPRGEGHSMYLRPTCVATDPFLGVGVPGGDAVCDCVAGGALFPGRLQAHHGRRRYGQCAGVARRRRRHENRGQLRADHKTGARCGRTDGRAGPAGPVPVRRRPPRDGGWEHERVCGP